MPERRFDRLRLALVTLVALGGGGPFGCEAPDTSDKDLRIINDRATLLELLADEQDAVVLVDVRGADEFAASHIPGAINIPVRSIHQGDTRLGEAKHLIVYSAGWSTSRRDVLSWAAAKKLLALGYQNVHDFRGGLSLWVKHGGEPVTVTRSPDELGTVGSSGSDPK